MGLAAGRNSQALRVYKLLTDDFLMMIRVLVTAVMLLSLPIVTIALTTRSNCNIWICAQWSSRCCRTIGTILNLVDSLRDWRTLFVANLGWLVSLHREAGKRMLHLVLKRDLIGTLEAQDLTGLVGGGNLEPQLLEDSADDCHLLSVRLRELPGSGP